jgi:molybdate transport system substrate-binding protein
MKFFASLALVLCHSAFFGQTITVAAAADLNPALSEVVARFEQSSRVQVKLAFGASGNLSSQIQNGAPFDVFLSADEAYPRQLINAGLADPASLYRYAQGKLVLWVPASSTLKVQERGMAILLDPAVLKIALANPQHAPYGRAAEAALRHAGLYEKVTGRLVVGENISQAAQFVESGSAQIGFLALSHALAPGIKDKGRYWEVPPDYYPPLSQAAVILTSAHNRRDAATFLTFLQEDESRRLLEQYGFSVAHEAR